MINMVINGISRVMSLEGDVDFGRLPQLTASFETTHAQKPGRFVIDLSKAQSVDCSVLALLMTGMQDAAAYGGKFMLAGVPKNLRLMFERSRMARCLPIYADVDEALAAP